MRKCCRVHHRASANMPPENVQSYTPLKGGRYTQEYPKLCWWSTGTEAGPVTQGYPPPQHCIAGHFVWHFVLKFNIPGPWAGRVKLWRLRLLFKCLKERQLSLLQVDGLAFQEFCRERQFMRWRRPDVFPKQTNSKTFPGNWACNPGIFRWMSKPLNCLEVSLSTYIKALRNN